MRSGTAVMVSLLSGCTFSIDIGNTPIDAADAPAIDMPIDEMVVPDPCMPVEVAASSAHNCARMSNGDVWCWGMNNQGQVGRPAQSLTCQGDLPCNPTPERIAVTNATGLGMADQHGCVMVGASTYCMGANDAGQFGDNSGDADVPRLVAQRENASQLVGGDTHTCSRHGDEVRCSGQNAKAECGDNSLEPRLVPVVTLASGSDFIGTGFQHMCSIDDGLVYCWGENGNGQSGGPGSLVMLPRLVQNVGVATMVTAGLNHTCALLQGGSVRCWGRNSDGQLGIGNNGATNGPVDAIVSGIVHISAGVNHTCALATGGTVYCWGEGYAHTPTEVTLPSAATHIASGSYHDCFVLAPSQGEPKGSIWCTGANGYGQLGRGSPGGDQSPGPVTLCSM